MSVFLHNPMWYHIKTLVPSKGYSPRFELQNSRKSKAVYNFFSLMLLPSLNMTTIFIWLMHRIKIWLLESILMHKKYFSTSFSQHSNSCHVPRILLHSWPIFLPSYYFSNTLLRNPPTPLQHSGNPEIMGWREMIELLKNLNL